MLQEIPFRFFLPVEVVKAKNSKGEDVMRLKGIASTSDRDADGEILDPQGLDLSIFKKQGYINWHHGKDPSSIIGEPTKVEVTKDGLYIEAELYSESPMAREAFNLAQTLERSSKSRRLGWSIEGKATRRNPNDPRHIEAALITNCALTPLPKNASTFAEIVKAMNIGDEKALAKSNDDPCWDDYEMIGTKKKGGKTVPNCVPLKKGQIPQASKKGSRWVIEKDCEYKGRQWKKGDVVDGTDDELVKMLDTQNGAALRRESLNSNLKNQVGFNKALVAVKVFEANPSISLAKAKRIFFATKFLSNMTTNDAQVTEDDLTKAYALLGITPDENDLLTKAQKDTPSKKITAKAPAKTEGDDEEDEDDLDDSAIMALAERYGLTPDEVRETLLDGPQMGGKNSPKVKKAVPMDEDGAEDDDDDDDIDVEKASQMPDNSEIKVKGMKWMKKGGGWYQKGGDGKKYTNGDMAMLKAYSDAEKHYTSMKKACGGRFKNLSEMVETRAMGSLAAMKNQINKGQFDNDLGASEPHLEAYQTIVKAQNIRLAQQGEMLESLAKEVEDLQNTPIRKSMGVRGLERFVTEDNTGNSLANQIVKAGGKVVDGNNPNLVLETLDDIAFNSNGGKGDNEIQKALTLFESSSKKYLPSWALAKLAQKYKIAILNVESD